MVSFGDAGAVHIYPIQVGFIGDIGVVTVVGEVPIVDVEHEVFAHFKGA